jgi:hypothetical protein
MKVSVVALVVAGLTIVASLPALVPVADAQTARCAPGTRDVGVVDGYASGRRTKIRLCALPNLRSTSEESTPGSAYSIRGANHHALVNARVSSAAFRMVNAAKHAGVPLSATSTFRTMAHQQALCRVNAACRQGNYTYVAKPGTSNHQLGLAIDLAGTDVKGGTSCRQRATDQGSPVWRWLYHHAATYGYRQYAAESWHWDILRSSTRC